MGRPVNPGALDPRPILEHLGIGGVTGLTRVEGGSDTALWRVERGREQFALRVFRPEQSGVSRGEIEAMEAARAAGVPVPTVKAGGVWHQCPGLLLEWRPGVTLWQAVRRQPWRI